MLRRLGMCNLNCKDQLKCLTPTGEGSMKPMLCRKDFPSRASEIQFAIGSFAWKLLMQKSMISLKRSTYLCAGDRESSDKTENGKLQLCIDRNMLMSFRNGEDMYKRSIREKKSF